MTDTALRPRKSRTKTGCLCCRLRRKKCDEQKPACLSCQKRKIVCSWLGSNEFAWRMRFRDSVIVSNPLAERAVEWTVVRKKSPRMPPRLHGHGDGDGHDHLLQFFIRETSTRLTGKGNSLDFHNPLQDEVPRLAQSDRLVMNAVLALAGIHMSYCAREPARKADALNHYVLAVGELSSSISAWVEGSQWEEAQRLLLVTVLLTFYEVVGGNTTGAMSHHLRACRQFAFHIIYNHTNLETSGSPLIGLLLETYAYLELYSSLRFSPSEEDIRTNLSSFVSQLDCLRQFETFGVLFGSASMLFETIPSISLLALMRRRELREHTDLGCRAHYESLDAKLASSISSSAGSMSPFERTGTMVLQHTLWVFLETAFHYETTNTHEFALMVEPHVEASLALLQSMRDSPLLLTLYWPMIVLGANARTLAQQNAIAGLLQNHTMEYVSRSLEMLGWIWNDPDPSTFGLPGLEKVAEERGTSLCIG